MKESKKYTLVEYLLDGNKVVSAIHYRDFWQFMREHPEAVIVKSTGK